MHKQSIASLLFMCVASEYPDILMCTLHVSVNPWSLGNLVIHELNPACFNPSPWKQIHGQTSSPRQRKAKRSVRVVVIRQFLLYNRSRNMCVCVRMFIKD